MRLSIKNEPITPSPWFKMGDQLIRTRMLVGDAGIDKLSKATVAVFGLGGVGGYTVEALARSGVGALYLCDNDTVSESNLNRQILATYDSIGKLKTEVAKARINSINSSVQIICDNSFVLPENIGNIDFAQFDAVVDAIDTVSGKIALIEAAQKAGVPIVSSMGTGNKMHAEMLEIADIYETSVCPLARVMRKELKDRGIKSCKVIFSKEEPRKPIEILHDKVAIDTKEGSKKRAIPASNAFVPATAGLLIAQEIIRTIIEDN